MNSAIIPSGLYASDLATSPNSFTGLIIFAAKGKQSPLARGLWDGHYRITSRKPPAPKLLILNLRTGRGSLGLQLSSIVSLEFQIFGGLECGPLCLYVEQSRYISR